MSDLWQLAVAFLTGIAAMNVVWQLLKIAIKFLSGLPAGPRPHDNLR